MLPSAGTWWEDPSLTLLRGLLQLWVVPVAFDLSFPISGSGTLSSFALLPTDEINKHRCSVLHLFFSFVVFQFHFLRCGLTK